MDTDTKRQRFGRAVRAARLSAGLSQAKLSKAINRDQGIVSDYEAGKSEPSIDAVCILERTLNLLPGALSRYLGWIPVDPADAPEPPEVPSTRSMIGVETSEALANFTKQLTNNLMTQTTTEQSASESIEDRLVELEATMKRLIKNATPKSKD